MITLPGLIDPHVHLRGLPTDNYKEDFLTGTKAALAGGFTTIFDMPNNPKTPTLTYDLLKEKQKIAKNLIVCDVGFFFGTNGKNLSEFKKAEPRSMGLKVFLSFSTANLVIDLSTFKKVCEAWTPKLPILLHAEENTIEKALEITKNTGHRIHICHISSAFELQQVINAKQKGYDVTCGVTPHHLFLTKNNEKKLGSFGLMKPSLKTTEDQEFLWKHIQDIDCIESDHAPHSKEEKESSNPPFGVTGLETTLGLLLNTVYVGNLTIEDIKRLCYTNPARIFGIKKDETTYIEIDENEKWVVQNENLFTKSQQSPFNGWELTGKVKKVIIRKTKVFENGKILAEPGFGKILK